MSDSQPLIMRPRARPVTINAGARLGVAGRITVTKFTRDGNQVPVRVNRSRRAFQNIWEHQQSNLITDAGLDQIGASRSFTKLVAYIAVGTGSATPAFSDTALGSESARTAANLGLGADELTRPSTGLHRFTRRVAYDFGEANGNLTEFGGFPTASGGSASTRDLFRDESGDPVVITKTSAVKLAVSYDIELGYAPTTLTPDGTVLISGYDTFDVSLMFYQAGIQMTYGLMVDISRLRVAPLTTFGTTYASGEGGCSVYSGRGSAPSNFSSGGSGQAIDAYVGASHEQGYTTNLIAGSSSVTLAGIGLQDYSPASNYMLCAWSFTDPTSLVFDKDYQLMLAAKLAWARA